MRAHDPVIVDAVRTPVSRRGGSLSEWHPVDLFALTLRTLVDRNPLPPSDIDDVIAGCVLQFGEQTGNLARHAVLAAGLPESVPGVTVDRQCGSGLQAVGFAAQAVASGMQRVVVAGGVESMSRVPMPPAMVPGAPLGPQYSDAEKARYGGRLTAQGPSAELLNATFGLTRDELDEFAARSHERAAAAWRAGRFDGDTVQPSADELPRRDEGIRVVDRAKMASLRPVFAADGTTTAANSSQLSDGAAALLITDRRYAEGRGMAPRARFRAISVAGSDPVIQFTAILDATDKALKTSGLSISDIDLFEVNEAFAGVPLVFQKVFDVPEDKLNVNGGSIAVGHPLGSTGARMLTDLIGELERRDARHGLLTICEATGTANTVIVERIAA
ncbi:thiolase family protein [Mycobacteroides abscessus]|uniref:thiolase family protein n=1 Tax=Mycobacteroides abscessus TaxID=36809 RepID=UPI000926BBC5|nr:thiolase family protein [Mycobacteroides abscessus]SHU87249.1 acetyl-CoA acetyltransferase [Mycobacteroides abscessus subsp. bolletii]SHW22310.1 acetyl-CoA acetyltransferase [Mycobacteroides abscessus subsp. bolletii]SHW47174.1 acetyl-CoA acetyltransferase [Mycobacteroides abscessus subsp. bolletii]SHX91657.1 acetyl-CoA acetyltransferase [Mycobacteroides abscessus subsp. bolletii]SKS69393.1 acetyl-CoA acetyltransferase [Mycobacteroides abscessus subsp. bolletii]